MRRVLRGSVYHKPRYVGYQNKALDAAVSSQQTVHIHERDNETEERPALKVWACTSPYTRIVTAFIQSMPCVCVNLPLPNACVVLEIIICVCVRVCGCGAQAIIEEQFPTIVAHAKAYAAQLAHHGGETDLTDWSVGFLFSFLHGVRMLCVTVNVFVFRPASAPP